jgi:penicillin-binding protein 2
MAPLARRTDDVTRSPARFGAFGLVALVLIGILIGRLVQLQVVDGATYVARVAATRTVEVPIPAARGLIFDREGRPVAINAPAWTLSIRPADLPPDARRRTFALLADLTGVAATEMRQRLESYRGSQLDLVPVARGLSREAALLVAERSADLPGVVVEVGSVRRYLDDTGVADGDLMAHVLGYTGRIGADEIATLMDAGYLRNDVVGRAGVEATFEDVLRGDYGARVAERDPDGRVGDVVDVARDPTPGENLLLTIDARTQRLATQALEWGMDVADVSQGVTVVMNPQTGEILAMVSLPSYDANEFAAGISSAAFEAYLNDPTLPLRNHAIADIYAPGSTYKLVTALAALEEGVTTPEREWPTYGCFQIPGAAAGECLRDWNGAGFGALDLVSAFAHSSDTYFYQLAIGAGIDPMAGWAAELGFGAPTGIALPGEAAGIVPSSAWARAEGRDPIYTGEVAQAGIGQSMVATTPLQILNAYAALANGGRLMEPMIVRGTADSTGRLVREFEPRVIRTLDVDPASLHTMRLAAREVITSGHAYSIRDLALPGALSGKTGTAEFGTARPDGALPFHSWFVAFLPSEAGATDAELAIVTFTYGASVPGNVSTEVVKYFLQLYYGLDQDLRLDPNDFSLVAN